MEDIKIKNKAIDKAPKNKAVKKPKKKVLTVIKEYAGIEVGTKLKGNRPTHEKHMIEKGFWAWK